MDGGSPVASSPGAPANPQNDSDKTIVGKRWQVLKLKLGEGNYGKVYQGKDLHTGMTVAVKVTNMRNLSDELQLRLRAETEILAKVNHPNIVQLYDQLQNGKYQLLMLEHLQGRDLDRAMVKGTPMPVPLVQRLYGDLCCGLHEMHRLNIVHRDLKPHNLLLSNPDPNHAILKIADFGFARYLGNVNDMAKTIAGSPLYMAPEVLEAALGSTSRGYNAKVDLFSSGIILYQMLRGEAPYMGLTQVELLQKMRMNKRKPLNLNLATNGGPDKDGTNWEAVAGPAVRNVLDRLLQPDPSWRIDSAEFFGDSWVVSCLFARQNRAALFAAVAAAIASLTASVHVKHLSGKKAAQAWEAVQERLSAANVISEVVARMAPTAHVNQGSFCSASHAPVSNASMTSSSTQRSNTYCESTALCINNSSLPGVMISLYGKAADLCTTAWRSLHSDKPILLEVVSLEDWQSARDSLHAMFVLSAQGVSDLLSSAPDLDCFYEEQVDSAEQILFMHAKEVSLRASVEEIMHNDTLAGRMYKYALTMMRIVATDATSSAHSSHRKTALRCADMLTRRIKRTTGAVIS